MHTYRFDPNAPDAQRYECPNCGRRETSRSTRPTCPNCGEEMRNIALPRE